MPRVSANDFVDFVLAGGTTRRTIVQKARRQSEQDYVPGFDYWYVLRREIRESLRNGPVDRDRLLQMAAESDERHKARYIKAVRGFLRYRGRREIVWNEPARLTWTHSGLTIGCTPDLAIQDRGSRYLLRLYYDLAALPRQRTQAMAALFALALHSHQRDVRLGFLDLERARITTAPASERWTETLEDEATNFMNYWTRLGPKEDRGIA